MMPLGLIRGTAASPMMVKFAATALMVFGSERN
jgi:hypothetical protein